MVMTIQMYYLFKKYPFLSHAIWSLIPVLILQVRYRLITFTCLVMIPLNYLHDYRYVVGYDIKQTPYKYP